MRGFREHGGQTVGTERHSDDPAAQHCIVWFERAAAQGCPGAEEGLVDLYSFGDGVGQDKAKAAEWFRRAAEQGRASAQFKLAEVLLEGGAETSAEQGDPRAMNNLAALLRQWWRLAAELGNESAM